MNASKLLYSSHRNLCAAAGMPIIPRRRLQLMLDELGPWLTKAKALDLIGRIDNEDPDQAIPAEYELSLQWAVSRIAELEIDPDFGGRTPDILTDDLFPQQSTVIEVTAISDEPLSGEGAMERTANIINQFADRVRPKASKHLHYTFQETSGYKPAKLKVPFGPFTHQSQYYRKRLTSWKFSLTPAHEAQMRGWLKDWPPAKPLSIVGEGTAVVIVWKDKVHSFNKTFSSMPSEAHDLKKNPIYERLKEKEKQLSKSPTGYLKCIFLGDAGCRLLREPNDFDGTRRRVSGKDIIQKFLADSAIDIVCILTPRRKNENARWDNSNPRLWHLYIYDKWQRPQGYHAPLERLRELLPHPYLHAYQARSWMQQGFLAPQARGQYLPLGYSGGSLGSTARISARALMKLLAGRMSATQFKNWITGDRNQFDFWLGKGYSISDVSFESQGADQDDDYIVLKMELDPNASPLRIPHQLMDDEKNKK